MERQGIAGNSDLAHTVVGRALVLQRQVRADHPCAEILLILSTMKLVRCTSRSFKSYTMNLDAFICFRRSFTEIFILLRSTLTPASRCHVTDCCQGKSVEASDLFMAAITTLQKTLDKRHPRMASLLRARADSMRSQVRVRVERRIECE